MELRPTAIFSRPLWRASFLCWGLILSVGFLPLGRFVAHGQSSDAAILQALRSAEDPAVRQSAALRLGKMDAAMALEPLMKALLADRSAVVRAACAQALSDLGAQAAMSALRAATHDEHAQVREKATAAIEKLTKLAATPLEKLVVLVSSPTGKASAKVASAIAGLPLRLREEMVRELKNSPDIDVREDLSSTIPAENSFAIESSVSSLSRRTTPRGELEVSFDINVVISLLPGKRVVGIVSGGASTFSPRNSAARLSKHEQTSLEEQALTQSVQAATENLVSFLRAQRKTKPH